MAVKAAASITIALERDIQGTWRFYRIASSSSAPSAPTESQGKAYVASGTVPSGWSKVEPAYDGTSTNSLYTVDLTAFTDGGVTWSSVSKSSSYEASKQAYNLASTARAEASEAEKVATNYIEEDETGIKVHNAEDPDSYAHIDSAGMQVYQDGERVAKFGAATIIGSDGCGKVELDSSRVAMYTPDGATALEIVSSSNTKTQTISMYLQEQIGKYVSSTNFGTNLTIPSSIATGTTMTVRGIVLRNGTVLGTNPFSFVVGTNKSADYVTTTPADETMTIKFRYVASTNTLSIGYVYLITSAVFITNLSYSKTVSLPLIKTTGDLILGDHSTPVGTVIRANFSKSLLHDTSMRNLNYNYTMPAGSWVINWSVRFPQANSGRRATQLYINGGTMGSGYMACHPAQGGETAISSTTAYSSSSDFTLSFGARQNSGDTQTINVYWDAIRIA